MQVQCVKTTHRRGEHCGEIHALAEHLQQVIQVVVLDCMFKVAEEFVLVSTRLQYKPLLEILGPDKRVPLIHRTGRARLVGATELRLHDIVEPLIGHVPGK